MDRNDAEREIDRIRDAINRVDEVIVRLLNQRAKYAIEIGEIKAFRREKTIVKTRGIEIGGPEVVVMAGPCTVESETQLFETARRVARAGARVLRGGAYKPRSSPYA
ncbi:MAG: hypothetical protein DMF57_13600, partial [Acidobacteria bacterium]